MRNITKSWIFLFLGGISISQLLLNDYFALILLTMGAFIGIIDIISIEEKGDKK